MAGRTRCGWWRRRWRASAAPWTVVFGGCTHGFVGVIKVILLLAVLLTVSTATTERPAATGSSSPPDPTRPTATPTLLPPPPRPIHSTSKFLHPRRSANPWKVEFGGCTFSGDSDGAPLMRTGSCPTMSGLLDLSSRGITSVPANAFQGMSQMTSVPLCV
jgi:hypothetical protein